MAVRHLTDEQIQRYLDGDMSRDSDAAYHLQHCPACQRQLQSYRKVYEGLQQDVGFELAPGFAESVMTRLAAAPERSSRVSFAGLILLIFGTVAVAGLALYFFEVKALTKMLASLSTMGISFGSSIVESLRVTTASLGVGMDIMLSAGLILLTFAAIDRILVRYRGSHFCL
jgi:anti-sigma factor RsiW